MTRQAKIIRERIKEQRERGQHEHPDEFAYALEYAQHIGANELGFLESYANGQLQLELYFRAVDGELCRQVGQDPTVMYRFRGCIGPKNATVSGDEIPNRLCVQGTDCQHVVLIAIRERVQVVQGMRGPSRWLHVVRLEPFDGANGSLVNSLKPILSNGALEIVWRLGDREQVLEAGRVSVTLDQLFDQVIESGPKVVNNVASDGRDFERWLVENLQQQQTACAVVGITLGNDRRVRLAVEISQRCCLQPAHILIGVSELHDNASERMMRHGAR